MAQPNPFRLQRLAYWEGQALAARDLNDEASGRAQLRWWHNRALHDTFGVSFGLVVAPLSTAGRLAGVRLGPGLAYDCFGRELVVTVAREIVVPESTMQASSLTLVLRYDEISECSCAPIASKTGWTHCATVRDNATVAWQERFDREDGVPLARIYDFDGEYRLDGKYAVRISRPLRRPKLVSATTLSGATAWEPWSVDIGASAPVVLGMKTVVDTSSAGFLDTPCYFAALDGIDWGGWLGDVPTLTHLGDESASGFSFYLWFPVGQRTWQLLAADSAQTSVVTLTAAQQLYVSWMGFEIATGDQQQGDQHGTA